MGKKNLRVCTGDSCQKNFSLYILDRLRAEKGCKYQDIQLEACPCQGNCRDCPTVVVEEGSKKTLHKKMTPIKASQLMKTLSEEK